MLGSAKEVLSTCVGVVLDMLVVGGGHVTLYLILILRLRNASKSEKTVG